MLNTAIILAGGLGSRLQSVVKDLPKPMAPIREIPFLTYQLRYLKYYGIKHVIISLGHLAEKVTSFYGDSFEEITLEYVIEKTPLGTGGGIRLGLQILKAEEVLVLNGDSFFDIDFYQFYNLHLKHKTNFSIALRYVENADRYGSVECDQFNRIISFKEKNNSFHSGLINAGVYILSKEVYLKKSNPDINFSIEKDFFEKQLNNILITGFNFEGYFIDIGIPEDYLKAENDFKEFKYR